MLGCANFLGRRDALLHRPWRELTNAERAFVAGYLCHLAADEDWKQFDWLTLLIEKDFGGVPSRVEAMVRRARDIMPRLWA